NAVRADLEGAGAVVEIIAPRQGFLRSENGVEIAVHHSLLTAASVLYDAVYVPGGTNSAATIEGEPNAIHFLNEAFKHCKAIAVADAARHVLGATYFAHKLPAGSGSDGVMREGIIIDSDTAMLAKQFKAAIAQHRFWDREKPRQVPA